MNAQDYDAWYDTPRGRWIGECEFVLAQRLLAAPPGARVLDAGCGTGWFTRRFAATGVAMTGVDIDEEALAYARRRHAPGGEIDYRAGELTALPFAEDHFAHAVSIAALCFAHDERQAIRELLRVTRGRFVIGWLNRYSLLYRQKGRDGGSGAWRGARWHSAGELRELFAGLPVRDLLIRSAVFLPGGTSAARLAETQLPAALPLGSMLFVAGRKTAQNSRL